jgi:hypothetical protein
MMNVEAKLGSDGVLRIVEINPFRACGVVPLLSSLVFGFNVFDLAFAEVLKTVDPPLLDKEILVTYARNEGETSMDLAAPIVQSLGGGRSAVELTRIMHEETQHIFEIHDGRIYEILREDDN